MITMEKVVIHAKVSSEVKRRVELAARTDGRTVSAYVARVLEQHLALLRLKKGAS